MMCVGVCVCGEGGVWCWWVDGEWRGDVYIVMAIQYKQCLSIVPLNIDCCTSFPIQQHPTDLMIQYWISFAVRHPNISDPYRLIMLFQLEIRETRVTI